MVFCSKIMTESPPRSGYASPRKSKKGSFPNIRSSSLSQLITSLDYTCPFNANDLIYDVPERDWRLLAILAKKRDEEQERQHYARKYEKMWQESQDTSRMVAAELNKKYRRYVLQKREDERLYHDFKNFKRKKEEQVKSAILMDSIETKHNRKANVLASLQDHKEHLLAERALDDEARALLAAVRRSRMTAEDNWRRQTELIDVENRLHDANNRRNAVLKDTAQRVAISNALSRWESTLLKQEVTALDEYRRAQHAAHAELTKLRSARLAQARNVKQKRAKELAAFTEQLRDCVRAGRM